MISTALKGKARQPETKEENDAISRICILKKHNAHLFQNCFFKTSQNRFPCSVDE
jgi:hypothetical protein